jgi:hypothetical protein
VRLRSTAKPLTAPGGVAGAGNAAVRGHGDPARGALAAAGARVEQPDAVGRDGAHAGLGDDQLAVAAEVGSEGRGADRGGQHRLAGSPPHVVRQRLDPVCVALGHREPAATARNGYLRPRRRR